MEYKKYNKKEKKMNENMTQSTYLANDKKNIPQMLILLFALVATLSLLSSCTTQRNNSSGSAIDSADMEDSGSSDDIEESGQINDVKKVDVDVADKKNQTEKTQDMIAQFVADGTYKEELTYNYHSAPEHVSVTLTVKGDVITDASVVGVNSNKMSLKYIGGFNAALPEMVVGKKIHELNLPKQVGGSSLTNAAFQLYVKDLIDKY